VWNLTSAKLLRIRKIYKYQFIFHFVVRKRLSMILLRIKLIIFRIKKFIMKICNQRENVRNEKAHSQKSFNNRHHE
jgi:hypothetical protein